MFTHHLVRTRVWLTPAVLTAGVSGWRLDGAPLWADELATWGAARLDWPSLLALSRHTDATLWLYYALTRIWISVAGDSDLALRLPSVLAGAAAAGLIGLLGRRLISESAGLLAGLVFAILPATSRFAQEARPYALVMMLATAATCLLVRALDRPDRSRLTWYALSLTVLGALHLVSLLLLPAHALTVAALAWRGLIRRTACARLSLAAGAGLVPLLPLMVIGQAQSQQISWIPAVTWSGLASTAGLLLGGGAAVSVPMIALALIGASNRAMALLCLPWVLTPALVLLAVSQIHPLWVVRYLLFTLPAWALLAGAALARIRLVPALASVLALAVVGLPQQITIRGTAGHTQASRLVQTVIAANYRSGDGIVYIDRHPSIPWSPRDIVARYLDPARTPRDVFAIAPQRSHGRLLATECADLSPCLANAPRLWLIRVDHPERPFASMPAAKRTLLRTRYRVARIWHDQLITICLLERGPAPPVV